MPGVMDSFDEFDHEYYKVYDDNQELEDEIIKVTNIKAFEPSERHHIAIITKRRNFLKEQNRQNNLTQKAWSELQALNWVLELLEEISEE